MNKQTNKEGEQTRGSGVDSRGLNGTNSLEGRERGSEIYIFHFVKILIFAESNHKGHAFVAKRRNPGRPMGPRIGLSRHI